ncbi:MAG: hypothetical protein JWL68_2935, partial [Actinomycetia bacterium]|nr:hypothetical protein [Actinomycetes bacterium]
MTGGRQSLLIPRTGVSDRPQSPHPEEFLQPTELLRPQRTLHHNRVLSQELRVIPGRTLTVESADHTFRIYDGDQLLAETGRTTTKPIARFKVRKP